MDASSPHARRRRPRTRRAASGVPRQYPWRQVRNRYPLQTIISDDQVEAIHQTSLAILEEIGMDFLHAGARAVLARGGADVAPGSERVRFDRGLVEQCLAAAPSSFTIHARNPARNLAFGDDCIHFAAIASPPNCSDLDGGRRVGNQRDFRRLTQLAQSLNIVHLMGGYPVEPVDLHASVRHLECLRDFALLTDKVFHAYSLGGQRIRDAIEIVRLARGVDERTLEREPSLFTIVNSSSPLRLDGPMLEGILEMSARNQVVVLTPFTLAGAMAPVTVAGAVAQQNAEALAGLVLTQLVRPGSPFVYGGFTSNVDMRSGAPAFGTPEYMKATIIGGQLARRYRLPFRSSNANACNVADAQAAWESVFSLWAAVGAGTSLVMHAAGWLEGGLCASYEKMIIDAELLQWVAAFLDPVSTDDGSLAIDAVREVGPGGHFFGAAHTRERFETAFYEPLLSDWSNFETWQDNGSLTATQRADRIAKALLEAYQEPAIDEGRRDAVNDFVERRIAEGGVRTDY